VAMRTNLGPLILLAVLVALSGCAAPVYAPPAGKSQVEVEQDWSECRQAAYTTGGAASSAFPYRHMNMAPVFNQPNPNWRTQYQCLEAHGWTQIDQSAPSARAGSNPQSPPSE
jgi:predicted small lipoprotein YifL